MIKASILYDKVREKDDVFNINESVLLNFFSVICAQRHGWCSIQTESFFLCFLMEWYTEKTGNHSKQICLFYSGVKGKKKALSSSSHSKGVNGIISSRPDWDAHRQTLFFNLYLLLAVAANSFRNPRIPILLQITLHPLLLCCDR